MQKSKRNHWVPQSYLRSFAADPESREKIWRFGKTADDPELKPIEKVAVCFYLYTPKDAQGRRDYSFEQDKLATLENLFGHPLWSKLCNEMVDLQWEPLRKMVALLAAVMYLRNPAQFERWKSMHRQIVGQISALPQVPDTFEIKGKTYEVDTATWPSYRDAQEDDLKRYWIEEIGNAAWYANILLRMRWAVMFSEEPVFITSDNPVTILHPSMGFFGLNDPETTVIFPLSPTRILHMNNRHSEPDGHYYPLRSGPEDTNLLLWRGANEHMFSHRHPDLVCAEMLRKANAIE